MTTAQSPESYLTLCPDLDEEIVRDFVSRMDGDYFDRFPPEAIARHLRLVATLTPDQPVQVEVTERGQDLYEVLVVAYDYFSEFATICGLLSAVGLDIREGAIYTSSERTAPPAPPSSSYGPRGRLRRPAGLSRNKIVDVFLVQPTGKTEFSQTTQEQFVKDLVELIALLDAHKQQDARRLVNHRLVETLGRARVPFSGLLDPVHIRVDNTASPTDTVLAIRSTDTPAFLYAFANALAMRNIDIRKARFENVGGSLDDRFFVRDRQGRKLEDPAEQQALVLTATIIKQFTHFLTWAPDPAKALSHFDLFLDRVVEQAKGAKGKRALAAITDKKMLPLLAQILGTSDFLWEDFLRRQHVNVLPMLEDYQRLPLVQPRAVLSRALARRLVKVRKPDARRHVMNQYKDQELFRIDMKHLLDPGSSLPAFSQALTELAETVIAQTVTDCASVLSRHHGTPRLADGTPCPFAVFGMGKFGGRELGYASDIEVLFVYGGKGRTNGRQALDHSEYFERLVQEILQWIEAKQHGIFQLDVRLRPHGGKGLLANTLDELQAYYHPTGLAAPFERQALIKLRLVSGDRTLGTQVEAHRNAFAYSGEPWDLSTALQLRGQQIKEFVEPGQVNVKYSRGGLIDVEYAVQYLQIMHGHRFPGLRTPNTLAALSALEETRLLPADEAAALRRAYLFLRSVIDALRIVRGHAKDLVLPSEDSDAFIFLARRLGYAAAHWKDAARKLQADITWHMQWTKQLFARRFGDR